MDQNTAHVLFDGPDASAENGPLILGIGGTTAANSSSERALRACLDRVSDQGARVEVLASEDLDLPSYRTDCERVPRAQRLVAAMRRCDGMIVSTPAYHGGMSGMIKNALDYAEDLRDDARPYLSNRAVGVIVCAYGAQAMGTTLVNARSVIHALRGWPTPLGVVINSAQTVLVDGLRCQKSGISARLSELAKQVVAPAMAWEKTS